MVALTGVSLVLFSRVVLIQQTVFFPPLLNQAQILRSTRSAGLSLFSLRHALRFWNFFFVTYTFASVGAIFAYQTNIKL